MHQILQNFLREILINNKNFICGMTVYEKTSNALFQMKFCKYALSIALCWIYFFCMTQMMHKFDAIICMMQKLTLETCWFKKYSIKHHTPSSLQTITDSLCPSDHYWSGMIAQFYQSFLPWFSFSTARLIYSE